ncbi:hypothetical protein [Gordonia amicalis]|uniref:hypothetical protein n=1 Tax=Gordonia amicalis TaxID=89053 RepID=UPI0002A64D00|nr:hypothetical protein [Gordonia amicalis]MBA5849631.1 hypothetical protein [Gordonia amicalis]MDV7173788.1 hypothetical protein [Gordonia amicalis]NKX76837.1 hypothetical protein [Gordonia amicalis]UKO90890.1 hypothetical protein IHQ52_18010 [Gordonia amicalis]UOG22397.1 hypothetical protein MTX80_05060 [Gordonia amicalis]
MTLPFTIPTLPLRIPSPDRGNRTPDDTFGVSPAEIEGVVTSWRANGIAVHAIDTAAIGDARGSSSRVAHALRDTAEPARRAAESIGNRLIAMSEILDAFVSTTITTDTRAASKLDSLRNR